MFLNIYSTSILLFTITVKPRRSSRRQTNKDEPSNFFLAKREGMFGQSGFVRECTLTTFTFECVRDVVVCVRLMTLVSGGSAAAWLSARLHWSRDLQTNDVSKFSQRKTRVLISKSSHKRAGWTRADSAMTRIVIGLVA